MLVHCVLCTDDDDTSLVHIFSTKEQAEAFCERDTRTHVVYDYVIDDPARMEGHTTWGPCH
jgi:hypothetical protein